MKNNRKGFTTVELVIVIAVIAILAAVLVPTFSNLIGKANDSAILQEARNMYTNYVAAVDYADGEIAEGTAYVKVVKGDDTFYVKVEAGSVKDTIYAEDELGEQLLGKILIEEDSGESGVAWNKVYCAGEHVYVNNICSKCTKEKP